jgi:Fe(3+) dicitrate transport protein
VQGTVRRAHLHTLAVSLACLVTLEAGARADDPPPAPPPPPPSQAQPIAEVRVIGDKADALQKVPGSGTLITSKEIEDAQPYDVSEMLRRVPGLTATQQESNGLRLDVGIHGLDPGRSRRVLILEDGVPISVNPYSEPDIYYVPAMERMRGIEVVKGSGNILFGPQTIGGVINFLTLMPPDHRHETAELDAGFWMGDRCTPGSPCLLGNRPEGYVSAFVSHGDAPSEHVRYIVQVMHKESDGTRLEGFSITDALGKVVFDTGPRGEATLKLGFRDDEAMSDDNGLTQGMYLSDPRQPTLSPADRVSQQHFDASVTHVQRFDDNTKLTTITYAYRTQRVWNRQDYDRNTPDASLLPLNQYDYWVGDTSLTGGALYFRNTDTILDRYYNVAGVEPRLEWRFPTGEISHTLNVGARLLYETAHYEQRTGSTPTSDAGTLDYVFDHSTYALATYAEDRLEVRDWLLVTPGIRIEEAHFTSNVTREGDMDTSQPGGGWASGIIPGIGMVAGTPKANVYAGMHVGWAPPRVTSPVSPNPTTTAVQLQPESSINYELGTRLTYRRLWHLEGTGYLINFNNQVISSSGDLSSSGATEQVNGGATLHYGLEGAASFGLGEALAIKSTAIDLGARYTFAHATFNGGPNSPYNGNWLPYAPAAALVGTLDVQHRSGIAGQVAWSYVGEQFTDAQNTLIPDATGRTGKLPAYQTVDVMLRYKLRGTGLTFKLAAKDATNQTYVFARRPDGIQVGGFAQILAGVRWDWDEKRDEGGAP